MPNDGNPLKVIAIEWQRHSKHKLHIGGIRLILSNGLRSPLFMPQGEVEQGLERVDLNFVVKRIRGTDKNDYVGRLIFENMDGSRSAKIEPNQTQPLDPN